MISKILVANRSEIAVRILRAARIEGLKTVAVYSEADKNALHVRMADESVCIGPPPATESYLNIPAIIDAAKQTGCQAIHPGYGFLAENSGFARDVIDAGLVFVGPTAEAIASMGDKLQARRIMQDAGVPVVPGVLTETGSIETAREDAARIGYPILVKAAGGGGGKGMRRVDAEADLEAALEGATREAASAFGDRRVYIERLLQRPRHVEIQVFADVTGATCHMFERECSIQRRHQKIIEETPSPALDESLRNEMGAAAVRAAQAVGYVGAGTVEFMLDEQKNFYFLEMNTRIQVEHPVTELITGIDLVRLQFAVARGDTLPFTQGDIDRNGHALECRIYAEDPLNNFLPSPGKLLYVQMPSGPGVRVDSGIATGLDVSTFYDPILAKIVTWGKDREESRERMIDALRETVILGVTTPIRFLIDVLEHPSFRAGDTHTGFLPDHGFLEDLTPPAPPDEVTIAAALYRPATSRSTESSGKKTNPWTELGSWRAGE